MEENIILNDLDINNSDSVTDETTILPDENSLLSDEDIQSISQSLLNQLVEQSAETSEDTETSEEQNEQVTPIDYTEQLSDIYNSIDALQSDIDSVSQSLTLQQDTLETLPEEIRTSLDDIIQFQYLTFSLIFGVLVAIIFFQGLKK